MATTTIRIRNTKSVPKRELTRLGDERYELMLKTPVRDRLIGLDRRDSLKRAQTRRLSRLGLLATTELTNMEAFVITADSDELIGIGTLQPELGLHVQVADGPTRMVRKLAQVARDRSAPWADKLSRPLPWAASTVNVAAWLRPRDDFADEIDEMTDVFNFLREQVPVQETWTLLPSDPRVIHLGKALTRADYQSCEPYNGHPAARQSSIARYDDGSAVGCHRAPLSTLYRAPAWQPMA
jgi:hypothetical protein